MQFTFLTGKTFPFYTNFLAINAIYYRSLWNSSEEIASHPFWLQNCSPSWQSDTLQHAHHSAILDSSSQTLNVFLIAASFLRAGHFTQLASFGAIPSVILNQHAISQYLWHFCHCQRVAVWMISWNSIFFCENFAPFKKDDKSFGPQAKVQSDSPPHAPQNQVS